LKLLPDPELLTRELLARANQSKPPVDLDCVIRLWGDLGISSEPLASDGYFVDLGVQGGEILVNSRSAPTRRRYTTAHELGHWVLKQVTGKSHFRTNAAPDQRSERWCHQFASALLMPASWVIDDLKRNRVSGLPDAVLSLPKKYDVSSEAFGLRISSVTPVSIVELNESNGMVRVGKTLQSTRVAEALVSGTIPRVSLQLSSHKSPQRYYCAETRLLCVSKRVREDDFGSYWLVCILPRISPD